MVRVLSARSLRLHASRALACEPPKYLRAPPATSDTRPAGGYQIVAGMYGEPPAAGATATIESPAWNGANRL